MIGSAVNYFGDRLLGVQMELWQGFSGLTSAVLWIDVFIVPFIAGIVVAWVFGQGGKWLCYFPPFIVRCVSYAHLRYLGEIPAGTTLIPLGWWGFFVILAIEGAAFGGIMGEVFVKKIYKRSAQAKLASSAQQRRP